MTVLLSNRRSKISILPLLSTIFFVLAQVTESVNLTKDYYKQTCPTFDQVVNQIVTTKQMDTPTTAAAVIRVFFHDCMVGGCDASTLVASNALQGKTERDADVNLSLPGDAFDLVTRVKTALELQCPGVVSCADILAVSARNLVKMTGGPYYDVPLGRKDGLVSQVRSFISLLLNNLRL